MNTEEKVKKLIAEHLDIQPEEVTDEASIQKDLGADSLDTIELIMILEKEFNRSIPDEDAEKLETVGQIVAYIEERVPA